MNSARPKPGQDVRPGCGPGLARNSLGVWGGPVGPAAFGAGGVKMNTSAFRLDRHTSKTKGAVVCFQVSGGFSGKERMEEHRMRRTVKRSRR